jgi:hypothetical protein
MPWVQLRGAGWPADMVPTLIACDCRGHRCGHRVFVQTGSANDGDGGRISRPQEFVVTEPPGYSLTSRPSSGTRRGRTR